MKGRVYWFLWFAVIAGIYTVLLLGAYISRHISSSTSSALRRHRGSVLEQESLVVRIGSHATHTKVTMFLDMSCKGSADIWQQLQKIILDDQAHAKHKFRIVSIPRNNHPHTNAEAFQLVHSYADTVEDFSIVGVFFFRQRGYANDFTQALSSTENPRFSAEGAKSGRSLASNNIQSGTKRTTMGPFAASGSENGCKSGLPAPLFALFDGNIEMVFEEEKGITHLWNLYAPIETTANDDSEFVAFEARRIMFGGS